MSKEDEKVAVNFKIQKSVKEEFEKVCDNLGLTLTSAVLIFIKQMIIEQSLPFTPGKMQDSSMNRYMDYYVGFQRLINKQEDNNDDN